MLTRHYWGSRMVTLVTVDTGTILTQRDALGVLRRNPYRVGDCALEILSRGLRGVSSRQTDLALIRLSELGLRDGARLDEVCEAGVALGLRLCTPDVGASLRLAYDEQPENEWLFVAMRPLVSSEGIPSILELDRAFDGLWLRGCDAYPGELFDPRYMFAFEL